MKKSIFVFYLFISSLSFAQQTDVVDFKRVEALIVFNQFQVDSTNYNSYDIKFNILKPTDSIYLDAIDMKFKHVALNDSEINYRNDGKKL